MLTAAVLPNGDMKLTTDNESRADIAQAMRDGANYWSVMADLFEGYACNGSYTHFNAGDGDPFVGLTSGPCIAEAMIVHDDGAREIDGRFWYFAEYAITDDLEQLRDRGRVVYTLARDE